MPSHFLAAGVYGCVYHPGYTCKGENMKRKKWVSKLTYDNEITRNEIEVGKQLKSCPKGLFVIVEESCTIPYKALPRMKEGCEMIKKGKKYKLLYSKYIESKELGAYLQPDAPFSRIFRCYYQLCELVSVLIDAKVSHHDLHFGNILYTGSKLMLIDFGLSILADKLDQADYRREVFSSYMPEWPWYPVDIHVLSFCVKYGKLTLDGLSHLLDLYLDNPIFHAFPSLRQSYRERSIEAFLPYVGTDATQLCEFWHTWDYYDIALRFLYLTQDYPVPELEPILFAMLHPDPSKRPSALEIRSKNQRWIHSIDFSRLSKIDKDSKEST